jgi:hypothetical protein
MPPIFDAIVARVRPAESECPHVVPLFPPIYLGWEIYTEINKNQFGYSKEWVSKISPKSIWLISIHDNGSWSAIKIDQKEKEIILCDPQSPKDRAWRGEIAEESSPEAYATCEHIRKWLVNLNHVDDCVPWAFTFSFGVQSRDDVENSGIYTLQTVCSWYAGRHTVDQWEDPIALRRKFVLGLRMTVEGESSALNARVCHVSDEVS